MFSRALRGKGAAWNSISGKELQRQQDEATGAKGATRFALFELT